MPCESHLISKNGFTVILGGELDVEGGHEPGEDLKKSPFFLCRNIRHSRINQNS